MMVHKSLSTITCGVSTGASSVTNHIQPSRVLLQQTDSLSSLSEPPFLFLILLLHLLILSILKSCYLVIRQRWFDSLVFGFTNGFCISYLGPCTIGREKNNLPANTNESSVSAAIFKELSRGHTVGSFSFPPLQSTFHCSPLGAIPKKDGSLYVLFWIFLLHRAVKHAFRLCPVHPSDWPLLGYKWLGKYLFDIRLPFRSRSSPFIFNIFADALTWILVRKFNSTTFSFVLLLLPSVNRKFPLFWMSFVTLVFPLFWINLKVLLNVRSF